MGKQLSTAEKLVNRLERKFQSDIQHVGYQDLVKEVENFLIKENFQVIYHRPLCPKCMAEFRPEKNGVGVVDMAEWGPCDLYDCDLWKCPHCGSMVILGFGKGPISSHYKEDFDSMLNHYRERMILYTNTG